MVAYETTQLGKLAMEVTDITK